MGDVQMANELLCISELNMRRGEGGSADSFIWPNRVCIT